MTSRRDFPQWARFGAAETGVAATEFAMVAPLAVALIFAAINAGFMMYSGSTLHFAAQDAARCGAVKAECATIGQTQSYAAAQYRGPATSPVFNAALTATCSQVTATAAYNFNLGIASFAFPINATACYPRQPTS